MAAKIPVGKIVEVIGKGRESADKVGGALRVDVLVDPGVPRWVALAVKDDLLPRQPGARVDVRALGGAAAPEEGVDAVVVLAGGNYAAIGSTVEACLGAGVPTAVVAESSLDVPELDVPEESDGLYALVAASERATLDDALAEWLIGATDKHVTMAANFPFCREAETQWLVSRCALENAAVGAVDLLHGADLPIMLGNQLRLLFDVAAANGRGLAPERLPEAVGVVAAGFVYRAITRSMVSHAPFGKFAVRAAMGYAGTVATGAAIQAGFGISGGTFRLPDLSVPSWLRDALEGIRKPSSPVRGGDAEGLPAVADASEETPDADPYGRGYLTYQPDGTVR